MGIPVDGNVTDVQTLRRCSRVIGTVSWPASVAPFERTASSAGRRFACANLHCHDRPRWSEWHIETQPGLRSCN